MSIFKQLEVNFLLDLALKVKYLRVFAKTMNKNIKIFCINNNIGKINSFSNII